MNTGDVCFGLHGNSFGSFSTILGMDATHIKLVHKSGTVGVDHDTQHWNHKSDNKISVYVTSDSDKVLAPAGGNGVQKDEWQTAFGPADSEVLLPLKGSTYIKNKEKLRVWYGWDLIGNEGDVSGSSNKICVDVYGWGKYIHFLKIFLKYFLASLILNEILELCFLYEE